MYKTNIRSWLKHLDFILLDILAITLAFGASYLIRENIGLGLRDDISYRSLYLTVAGFHILTAILGQGYSNIIRRGRIEEAKNVLRHTLVLLGCVMLYLVFTKQSEPFSRIFLGCLFAFTLVFTLFFRLLLKRWIRESLKKSEKLSKLLILSRGRHVSYFILHKTTLGRKTYAVGGNEKVSFIAGIKIDRIKIFAYTITGFLCGMAGAILTSRLNSAQPTAGTGYELDAIAAVVLGGTSLSGGKGRIVGTIIGALIIGTLNNGLNILNVSSFYQQVVKGIVILLAVLMDRKKS